MAGPDPHETPAAGHPVTAYPITTTSSACGPSMPFVSRITETDSEDAEYLA
jgi:hypothetical protein